MTRIATPDAPHVLAIVQAGGQGSRMDVLTRERAKPALPYAGSYRLVDLAISAAAGSGIGDVWVTVQYMASTLDDHLQHGRPWDLDRVRGGYRRMVPETGRTGVPAFSESNTEDLLAIRDDIEEQAPDLVITLSADQVLVCDLAAVVAGHVDAGAECTILSLSTTAEAAQHKAVLEVDGQTVTGIAEKPEDPGSEPTISAEVAVFDWPALREVLDAVRAERSTCGSEGAGQGEDGAQEVSDEGPGDLPEEVLPRLIERGRTRHHPIDGYWRDMGRPDSYLQGHRDLLHSPEQVFGTGHLVVRGSHRDLPPAVVTATGEVSGSMLSPGCRVAGTVERSVLSPGVVVEKGAHVVDSVVFEDVHVAAGARIASSIIDAEVQVGAGASVGQQGPAELSDEDVTLIGREAVVLPGAELPAGSRLDPGGRAGEPR